jgi:branched-chain amino acid aminotransferase
MAHPSKLKPVDKLWLDGELIAFDAGRVHVLTHSLHYGLGAFEGIRSYRRPDGRGAVFRLADHIDRLFRSCHIATVDIPYTREELEQACLETLRANNMSEAYLRPLAFIGDGGGFGLGATDNPVRVAIAVFQWGAYLGEEGLKSGIRAKVSSFTRGAVNSAMSKGKITGQYVNSVLAKREAMKAGYAEAILLDAQGHVAEATGENLFMVRRGVLYTPPLSSPILDGITRDTVLTLAREAGIETIERTFARDELYLADEVFLCGTAAEITPVREIDDRTIGPGGRGPITERLQTVYFETVRGKPGETEPTHPDWLTYVDAAPITAAGAHVPFRGGPARPPSASKAG